MSKGAYGIGQRMELSNTWTGHAAPEFALFDIDMDGLETEIEMTDLDAIDHAGALRVAAESLLDQSGTSRFPTATVKSPRPRCGTSFPCQAGGRMKIAAIRLFNVKRFAGRGVAIENIGNGVNVLTAANEFGKSTSFEALHALFFQHTPVCRGCAAHAAL